MEGGSEQHLLTPLRGAPGAPRANSQSLYVGVFYSGFGTIALPFFCKKLYLGVFYNEFCTFARKIKLVPRNGVMKCSYEAQIPENVKK